MPPDPSPAVHGGAAEAQRVSAPLEPAWARDPPARPRLPSGRARSLPWLALLGAAAMALWLHLLAAEPHLPLNWRLGASGQVELDASTDPALQALLGQPLAGLVLADGRRIAAENLPLPDSPRWMVDDAERRRQDALRGLIGSIPPQARVVVAFDNGQTSAISARPRGLTGLGTLCWVVCALALALYLAAVVLVLAEPGLPAALYAVLAGAQCLNLLLIAAQWVPGTGLPPALVAWDGPLRLLADAVAAAALLHLFLRYPHRRAARWPAPLAWTLALCSVLLAVFWPVPGQWWWTQAGLLGYGLAAAAVLRRARRLHGSALAALFQWLVLAGTGTLALLSLAVITTQGTGPVQHTVASVGPLVWAIFFALLLMLGPVQSRSRQVQREFGWLVGVAGVATGLNLLFEALGLLQPLPSLALSLVVSLVVYLVTRPWILGQRAGSSALSAERMFDSLYRVARELEKTPEQASRQLSGLLREVFDPLEVARSARSVSRIRLAADGSTLVVPLPTLPGPGPAAPVGAIVLRHARRGRRLFTLDDLQLTERLIEQLQRAVAYDRAVEHGRTEERLRIAQDLHDDIGARLLTLMYKAPNPEIEEYIRHTLQDLKTLTRGLAASNHRLSHAAAEWKADITQRLNATGCDLRWSFSADHDLTLTVVQWSALTRVLRELVNNIITHAQATQVEINAHLDRGRLTLTISDDGRGSAPANWSHGLGLGGVRKRVKLLGGQVQWTERELRGIRCEVVVPLNGEKA